MPIFTLTPGTTKKLTNLMDRWVLKVRSSRGNDASPADLADHAAIYLSGAAAALSEISYQNDGDKILFREAIDDVVRDLREHGGEALTEWVEKLVNPERIAHVEQLSRLFGSRTK